MVNDAYVSLDRRHLGGRSFFALKRLSVERLFGARDGEQSVARRPPNLVWETPQWGTSQIKSKLRNRKFSALTLPIGNSRLWNWCSNSLCAILYVHGTMGRQPVIVCHEAGFDASSCCIEPGQLPPENFTSMASCPTNTTSTMLPQTAKSGMPGTTLQLIDKPGMPEPDAPSNPLDAALILGVVGGVALVVLIGVVVSIVQWRRRRAGANVPPEPSHYGILPPAKGAPTYDDVIDVHQPTQ